MIETHLNLFDASVIGVLVLSCLFAFFRGFVREVLSLGAWIGAAIITMYYFPDMAAKLKPHFKSTVGATGVATLIIYTASLIGFSIVNSVILKFVRSGSEIGMLDNAMGFLFGAARGVLIISLGYFLLTIAIPEKEYPDWLKKSITRPYAEMGAIKLAKVAPDYLREISTLEKKAVTEMQDQKEKETENADDLNSDGKGEIDKDMEGSDSANLSPASNNKSSGGYTRSSSNQLNQLINSNSDQ